jgi:hypothetical protein
MTETRIQRLLAPRTLPVLSALTAVLLTDATILIGIIMSLVNEPVFQATLRFAQAAVFLAAVALGCLALLATINLRRAPQPQSIPDGRRPQLLTAFRWSLYLTVILLAGLLFTLISHCMSFIPSALELETRLSAQLTRQIL